MHAPPRLRLEPYRSPTGLALFAIACLATGVLTAVLLPLPAASACVVAIGVVLYRGHRRLVGHGVPAIVHIGIDRTITVTDREGRSRDGRVLADSYVGALLTTVVWRAQGQPWWRPADVILVLPDTLPPDDFRRLRIYLRYGGSPTARGTSDVDAG